VVVDDGSVAALDLDVVPTAVIVPGGADDLVLEFNILKEIVFLREVDVVVVNLLGPGVNRRPVQFRLKAPCVVVRWDVACATMLGLEPGLAQPHR
jgi:hypothetical protein